MPFKQFAFNAMAAMCYDWTSLPLISSVFLGSLLPDKTESILDLMDEAREFYKSLFRQLS